MPLRQLTDVEIERHKTLLAEVGDVGLLMPTATGLEKSILDATISIRALLKSSGLHDYAVQPQGADGKALLITRLLSEDNVISSRTSLYRPNTKQGDPRIWFSGLGGFADANDLLAVFADGTSLIVINLTKSDVPDIIRRGDVTEMGRVLRDVAGRTHAVADELLGKLRDIAKFAVPAVCTGDTAVGRTLETLLGIGQNSSKMPDYKGIELKSYRGSSNTRSNLFAQVPSWSKSTFKSFNEFLNVFGYPGTHERQLNCTVSSSSFNSQGLRLSLDLEGALLSEISRKPEFPEALAWDLPLLHKRLLTKHRETFWIKAQISTQSGREMFRYETVRHTSNPSLAQFDELLGSGGITVDHLISRDGGSPHEKGPLFKIARDKSNLLFPEPRRYRLF